MRISNWRSLKESIQEPVHHFSIRETIVIEHLICSMLAVSYFPAHQLIGILELEDLPSLNVVYNSSNQKLIVDNLDDVLPT